MRSKIITAAMLGSVAITAAAFSQTPPAQQPSPPPAAVPAMPPASTTTVPAAEARPATQIVSMSALENGANSFTEGQARSRFEDAGFTAVQGLTKDDSGIWRGRGMRNGASVDIGMDFRGRIAAGTGGGTPGGSSMPPPTTAPAPAVPPSSPR